MKDSIPVSDFPLAEYMYKQEKITISQYKAIINTPPLCYSKINQDSTVSYHQIPIPEFPHVDLGTSEDIGFIFSVGVYGLGISLVVSFVLFLIEYVF